MRAGLALPQYRYTRRGLLPDGRGAVEAALEAERLGFDAVFLADHLFMSIEKYGGPAGRHPGADPFVALAAVADATSTIGIGTLVLNLGLRPTGWVAKNLAGLDVLAGGRLVAGVGAGWLEEEFAEAGVGFPPASERLRALEAATAELRRTFRGEGPPLRPPSPQEGGPPLWVGGKGDKAVGVAARVGDGWNVVWRWTLDGYRERLSVFRAACEEAGRDPAGVVRSVGLTTLVGEDEADVVRRFEHLAETAPRGVVTEALPEWRRGRLVGTVEQVRDQLGAWRELGVAMVIADVGALPFSADVDAALPLVAAALTEES